MKKIAVVTAVLILAILLANTALGKYVRPSGNSIVAGSNNIEVLITERIMESNSNSSSEHTNITNPLPSLEETLGNLSPGDTVSLSYKIENRGCVDVLLEGVNISIDNQKLKDCLTLKWTVTQFKDCKPVNTITNSQNGQPLAHSSGMESVSSSNIVLDSGNGADDYCLLEIQLTFDDDSACFSEIQQTVFTVTPLFIQY